MLVHNMSKWPRQQIGGQQVGAVYEYPGAIARSVRTLICVHGAKARHAVKPSHNNITPNAIVHCYPCICGNVSDLDDPGTLPSCSNVYLQKYTV